MNQTEFLSLLDEVYGSAIWPGRLRLLQAARAVDHGSKIADAARFVRTNASSLQPIVDARDRIAAALGLSIRDLSRDHRQKAEKVLGQMLLGRCAEMAFEDIYRTEMQSQELDLRDLRESRTDTDYRLYNGQGRPVYRINIKFHGAQFQRALELVSIPPEDCFALATYKIYSALRKQDEERLPYFFAIVGVPHLTAEVVGQRIPSRFTAATGFQHQAPKASAKRDFEDRLIDHIVTRKMDPFQEVYRQIVDAKWFVLSARRAFSLLKDKLFDRAFALRVPNFAQQFRRAELDMHFSLSKDLTPLRSFLATLRSDGHAKVITQIERGEI